MEIESEAIDKGLRDEPACLVDDDPFLFVDDESDDDDELVGERVLGRPPPDKR